MTLASRVTRIEGDGFVLTFESRGDYLRAQVDEIAVGLGLTTAPQFGEHVK